MTGVQTCALPICSFELRKNVPATAGVSVVNATSTDSKFSPQSALAAIKIGASDEEGVGSPRKSDPEQLNNMLDKVNRQMEINSSNLRFKADESSGKMVVAIYDASTEELIRQIPNEQALATAQRLSEFMERTKSDPLDASSSVGLLLNSQA